MVTIPKKMNNKLSKLVAGLIVQQRAIDVASAKAYGIRNRIKKEFGYDL